jgi:N-acetylglucosaminyldiphosphoundecaprenol N-acetyl-beta-D-mannosaminyltransferase
MEKIIFNNGLWINNFKSYSEAVSFVTNRILDDKSYILNFLYFSCFVIQEKNFRYRNAINNSDFLFLDGIGMHLYTRIVYKMKAILNLNGTDLIPKVLEKLNGKNSKAAIALYGAKNSVIEKAHYILKNKYENLNFYYYSNGYVPAVLEELKEKSTLLIGLGTPKQEIFVQENYELFKKKKITTISVGGLFDFVGGNVKRAPKWVRNINMEWAYRMLKNPLRHFDKNIRNLTIIKFILRDLIFK